MIQLQNDSLQYLRAEAFSIMYSGAPQDSTPIRMLLSDMWIWGEHANSQTEDKPEAWLDVIQNPLPGEADNDLHEAMNRLNQRLEKDSNCEPSWTEYTEGYLRYAKDCMYYRTNYFVELSSRLFLLLRSYYSALLFNPNYVIHSGLHSPVTCSVPSSHGL
jgi:hypothetical protein